MHMLNLLGKLIGVDTKSKLTTDGGTMHTLVLKLELLEGETKIQDVVDLLKKHIEVEISSKQPTLVKPYPDA